jgi:hypothetical protein
MYEALTGSETVHFEEPRGWELLPDERTPGARQSWPGDLARELARAFAPRGAGVLLRLEDASIDVRIDTVVTAVAPGGDLVRGRLEGDFELRAPTLEERGVRPSYRPFRGAQGTLHGDFVFDTRRGQFESLRLVSTDATSRFAHGKEKDQAHRVAVELLPRQSPRVW